MGDEGFRGAMRASYKCGRVGTAKWPSRPAPASQNPWFVSHDALSGSLPAPASFVKGGLRQPPLRP